MKILVLGGTKFVGRHIVNAAIGRKHDVTIFNRGKSNPELFPQVEKLIGDRDGGLDQLKNRQWDAIIDVNGYLPRLVRDSAELLRDAAQRYTFISTISVYADFSEPGLNEDSQLDTISDPTTEVIDGETYGALKVLCEETAEEIFPEQTLIIRPGFVVGPNDHTDRFTSWLRRIARGGEMLAPSNERIPVQFIDGRDLADFVIQKVEAKDSTIYNATGPAEPLTWGELFAVGNRIAKQQTQFTWVSDRFIKEQDLAGLDLPMWSQPSDRGLGESDISRALQAGLVHRPLDETIRDTLNWDTEHGSPRAGLSPEREAELLELWHGKEALT